MFFSYAGRHAADRRGGVPSLLRTVSLLRAWVQIGYFGLLPTLTPDLPDLLRALHAEAPGTKIALDTVNPPADAALLDPILASVDLFAPSRIEAEALTGETDPRKMVKAFRRSMKEAD